MLKRTWWILFRCVMLRFRRLFSGWTNSVTLQEQVLENATFINHRRVKRRGVHTPMSMKSTAHRLQAVSHSTQRYGRRLLMQGWNWHTQHQVSHIAKRWHCKNILCVAHGSTRARTVTHDGTGRRGMDSPHPHYTPFEWDWFNCNMRWHYSTINF
jgi:hypothetical protein